MPEVHCMHVDSFSEIRSVFSASSTTTLHHRSWFQASSACCPLFWCSIPMHTSMFSSFCWLNFLSVPKDEPSKNTLPVCPHHCFVQFLPLFRHHRANICLLFFHHSKIASWPLLSSVPFPCSSFLCRQIHIEFPLHHFIVLLSCSFSHLRLQHLCLRCVVLHFFPEF